MAIEDVSAQELMRLNVSRKQLVIAFSCVILASMLRPGAATLILVSLLPALPAFLYSGHSRSYGGVCVGAPNMAAMSYIILEHWEKTDSIGHALNVLSTNGYMYLLAGCILFGWAVFFVVPVVIFRAIIRAVNSKIISKQKLQSQLIKEWGAEVSDGAPVMVRPFNGNRYRKKFLSKHIQEDAHLEHWEQVMVNNKDELEIDPDCIYTKAQMKKFMEESNEDDDDDNDKLLDQLTSQASPSNQAGNFG